ncbi:hypothetical protein AAGS61_08110 [Lysinibacillus sp. KU-BSD001]|uniref:hypothetical protein n=1 Tax=Lysinibacillus sp. KU-BSD001 TaxID=3141328 RepID=UPI0036E3B34D
MNRNVFFIGLFIAAFFMHQFFNFDGHLFHNWVDSLLFAFWCVIAVIVLMIAEKRVKTVPKKHQ